MSPEASPLSKMRTSAGLMGIPYDRVVNVMLNKGSDLPISTSSLARYGAVSRAYLIWSSDNFNRSFFFNFKKENPYFISNSVTLLFY